MKTTFTMSDIFEKIDDDIYEPAKLGFTSPESLTAPIKLMTAQMASDPVRSAHLLDLVRRVLPARRITQLMPRHYPDVWDLGDESPDMVSALRATASVATARSAIGLPKMRPVDPDSQFLSRYGASWLYLERVSLAYQASLHHKDVGSTHTRDVVLTARGFAVALPDRMEVAIGSYDQFLLLVDAARARFCSVLAAHMDVSECDDPLLVKHVCDLFAYCDLALRSLCNDGYACIKSIEGVFKGRAMQLWGCEVAESPGLARALAKLTERSARAPEVARVMERIVERVTNPLSAKELFGLMKFSGFPVVDEAASVVKARTLGQDPGDIDPAYILKLGYACRGLFLEGYLERNSQWPPFVSPPREGTLLEVRYRARMLTCPAGSYPATDWEGVILGKCYSVDERADTLESLDDKACCSPSSVLGKSILGTMEGPLSRSVLEVALCGGRRPVRETLEAWKAGWTHPEDRVCRLSIKGGEMKPEGRLFAMFTYEGREGRSVMERALQKDIQPLFKYATKPLSQQALGNKLAAMSTRGMALEGDFESWNLNWKGSSMSGTASMLNELYGEDGLWDSCHESFSDSVLFLPTDAGIPGVTMTTTGETLPDGHYVWRGHGAGLEGQFQIFWEIGTFAMMHVAFEEAELRADPIGQGDNQCAGLGTISGANAYRALATLEAVAKSCGHVLKQEECDIFNGGFTYGKRWFIRGTEHRCVIKHVATSLAVPSDVAPTLSGRIAVPSTGAASVSNHVADPLLVKAYSLVVTDCLLQALDRSSRYGYTCTKEELRRLVEIPGMAGGFSITPISAFLWRGHTDPLSSAIASARLTGGFGMAAFAHALESPPVDVDPKHLIEDPYSIPLPRPADPRRSQSKTMVGLVTAMARSPLYTSTMKKATELSYDDELVKLLKSSDTTHPLILHELAKASHRGVALRLVARFSSTSTIRKIAGRYGIDLAKGAVNAEIALIDWMRELVATVGHFTNDPLRHMSVFEIATKLRAGWGVGTPEGLTTVNPLAGHISTSDAPEWVVTAVRRVDQDGQAPRRFYRGSRTEARVVAGSSRAVVDTSTLADIRALMALWTQFPVEGPLRAAITNCVWLRSGFHAHELENFFPRAYGGTAAHRLTVHDRVPFDLACSPRLPSQLSITTNGMNTGDQDLPIALQEIMLYVSAWCSIAIRGGAPPTVVHHHSALLNVPLVQEDPVSTHEWVMRGAPVPNNAILTAPYLAIDHSADENISALGVPIAGTVPRDYSCTLARILGTLGRPGRVNAISAGVEKVYARDVFDKTEVHALNPRVIIRASTHAVIILGMAHTLVAGRVYEGRIGVQAAFEGCAKVVTQLYWEHFRTGIPHQEWMADQNIVAEVGEMGLVQQQAALAGELASRAMHQMMVPPKTRRWTPLPFAASGLARDAVVRLVLAGAAAKELAGPNFGGPTSARAIGWVREQTYGSLRSVARRRGCLGSAAASLLRGRGVHIIGTSPAEALRWVRGELFPHAAASIHTTPPRPEWCLVAPGSGVLVEARDPEPKLPNARDVFFDSIDRAALQDGGNYTKAIVAAYDAIPPGRGAALCVGQGQGGSAAALAMLGYHVTGLDLLPTIPDDPIAIRSYAPPEVSARKLNHAFRLSPLIMSGGGDWNQVGVSAIMECEPNLVYIGIERGNQASTIKDLVPVIQSCYTGTLVVRVVGDEDVHNTFGSILNLWGAYKVERPPTCNGGMIAHHVVTINVAPSALMGMATPPRINFRPRESTYTISSSPQRSLAAAVRLIFGFRSGVGRLSLHVAAEVIKTAADDAETNSRRYIPRSTLMRYREAIRAVSILEECLQEGVDYRVMAFELSDTPFLRRVVTRALGLCLAAAHHGNIPLSAVTRTPTG